MKRLDDFLSNVMASVVANVLILLATLLLGSAVALFSNSLVVGLLVTLIILVLMNILISLLVLRRQSKAPADKSTIVSLCRDDETGTPYLIDIQGRAREVPGELTLTYLASSVGFFGDISQIPSDEIARIRGEKLVAVDRWERDRPRTAEEEAEENFWHGAVRALEKTESRIDSASREIVVSVTNRGKDPILVNGLKLQHMALRVDQLSSQYQRASLMSVIPVDHQSSNLLSGQKITVRLKLAEKAKFDEMELSKGQWGWLRFDVSVAGKHVYREVGIAI